MPICPTTAEYSNALSGWQAVFDAVKLSPRWLWAEGMDRIPEERSSARTTEEALRVQNARLAAPHQVALSLTSTLELRDVLQHVARMAQTLSTSAHAHIYLFDPQRDELELAASYWASDQKAIPLQPRRTGITHSVASTGEAEFIENSASHSAYASVPSSMRPGAIACLPLVTGNRVLGTLNLGYWQPYQFDPDTRSFLDLLARHAAIAIENARLYIEAKRDAEELARRVQELVVVNKVSRYVNALDLDQVMQRGLNLIVTNLEAVYCVLGLYDSVAQTVKVRAVMPQDDAALGMVFNVETSRILTEAMKQPRPVIWRYDPSSNVDHPLVKSLLTRGTRRLVITPLIIRDIVEGFVAVDPGERELAPSQMTMLQTIGNEIAMAMESARLHEVALEKARLERELQVARGIQTSLIPRATPQIEGWNFAAWWQPAREVSGDFYDFISNAGASDRSLLHGMVIADVSDKGMPAAIFMALARNTIRASVTSARSAADCIAHANQLICADTANGMFITLFYAQLDPTTGEMIYVNAGHNPALFYSDDTDELIELARTGIALGADEKSAYCQRNIKLGSGDFVLFYTDGVTDAVNAEQRAFGEEQLRRVILQKRHTPAAEMVAALQQALSEFVSDTPQFDDMTLVVVKRL